MSYSIGEQVRLPLRLRSRRAWGQVETIYEDGRFYQLLISYGNRCWRRKVSQTELEAAEKEFKDSRRRKRILSRKRKG